MALSLSLKASEQKDRPAKDHSDFSKSILVVSSSIIQYHSVSFTGFLAVRHWQCAIVPTAWFNVAAPFNDRMNLRIQILIETKERISPFQSLSDNQTLHTVLPQNNLAVFRFFLINKLNLSKTVCVPPELSSPD